MFVHLITFPDLSTAPTSSEQPAMFQASSAPRWWVFHGQRGAGRPCRADFLVEAVGDGEEGFHVEVADSERVPDAEFLADALDCLDRSRPSWPRGDRASGTAFQIFVASRGAGDFRSSAVSVVSCVQKSLTCERTGLIRMLCFSTRWSVATSPSRRRPR